MGPPILMILFIVKICIMIDLLFQLIPKLSIDTKNVSVVLCVISQWRLFTSRSKTKQNKQTKNSILQIFAEIFHFCFFSFSTVIVTHARSFKCKSPNFNVVIGLFCFYLELKTNIVRWHPLLTLLASYKLQKMIIPELSYSHLVAEVSVLADR